MNSPRSIEACKRKGVMPHDLTIVDFNTYKNSSLELKSLPQEVLELRYGYIEKIRSDHEKLCVEERRRMIEEGDFVPEKSKIIVYLI